MQMICTLTRIRLMFLVVLLIMVMLVMKADTIVGASDVTAIAPESLKLGSTGMTLSPGDMGLSISPGAASRNAPTVPAAGCASASFSQSAGSPFGVGANPRVAAVGDFNADGRPDLVTSNGFSANISVLLGNGTGGFSGPTNFAVPNAPIGVAVGDFNADGRLDVAVTVANAAFNYVSILLGEGTGGFSGLTNFSVGLGPRYVVVADFNSDGRPDLVVANGDSANVSVLLGNGMGGFSAASNFAAGTGPNWLAVRDFNRDGKLDVAVANSASTTVSILLGNGLGGFSGPTDFAAGSNPASVVAGDFNADGQLDLATANLGAGTVSILLGNGLGGFSGPTNFVVTGGPSRIAAGDFNADGQLDLAVGDSFSDAVSILLGNGAGGFSAQMDFAVGVAPSSVVVADLNLDGTLDLAVTNGTSSNVTILLNTCTPPPIGPGSTFPTASEVSDQKAGSVLVYNLYSSSIAAPNQQNTRVSLTNTNPSLPVAVHLFFVDGATCSIADSLICLTPNQTASFLASDIDPGTTGYIVAVASDTVTGCPVNFNYLIGDEYVKLSSGHAANLAAESFAALAGGLPACDVLSVTTVLNFDGISYNRAPRVVAASNIPSRADVNDTLIVLNRLGGSLAVGAATLGSLFGILYDDAENPLSFTFTAGVCQFRSSLSNNFPRTAPRFEQFIPAGRSGWAKFYSLSDVGLLGAQINFNPNAGTAANAFNQGHNLHKLSLTTAAVLTIPIFPPNC